MISAPVIGSVAMSQTLPTAIYRPKTATCSRFRGGAGAIVTPSVLQGSAGIANILA